jgi:methylmalonyl-CoA mutase cobalamin-binding subunit
VNEHMRTRAEYVVALVGVGGDAHSVGLIILDRFLRGAGFDVRYLGIRNAPLAGVSRRLRAMAIA